MNGLPIDCRPQNMETSASYQENAKGYFQTKAACYFAIETYAPGQYNDPQVSPILTEDLKGLPPAVIINAEFDPLRDDGVLYAANLRKAGVKVWDKCFAGQIHCLIGLPPDAAELKEYATIVKTAMNECFPGLNGREAIIRTFKAACRNYTGMTTGSSSLTRANTIRGAERMRKAYVMIIPDRSLEKLVSFSFIFDN